MNKIKKLNKTVFGIVVYISVFLLLSLILIALPFLIFDIKSDYEAVGILFTLSLFVCILFPLVSNLIYNKTLQKLNVEISNKFYCNTKTYGKTNNIRMSWFDVYIKVFLPFRTIFSILSVISFLGNLYSEYQFTGLSPWTDTVLMIFIINIAQFFVLCYTYIKMKNLKPESYKSNIVYMVIGIISISITYLSKLQAYGALSLIPIAIYLIIWILPNFIYFKKRKSIFGFDFGFDYQEKTNTEYSQLDNIVYNNFDVYWVCPNCGRQNQSIKCFGCGLTKEEAINKNNSEESKQNESIPVIKTEQEPETSSESTEELLNNEKFEKLLASIKPETTDKVFQNDKEKIKSIIISLSEILNINLKECDIAQYKNIINIYGKIFIWKTEKNASDNAIILSLQKYHKDYITSEDTAKKVLEFCTDSISMNNPMTEANEFKFCNVCGNKLDNDYEFCNKCGNKVR